MPTLICDLRPGASALAEEYRTLRAVGEAVVLFLPRAAPIEGALVVGEAAGLDAALDDERLVRLPNATHLPPWVPPLSEFHRILLITGATGAEPLPEAETRLLRALFAAGADEVELVPAAAALDLSQSWHSGRRAGARCLRPTDVGAPA
ncbi:MAG TPA: hypothetical protein VN515_06985 [Terriglobales bacterium]|nr:hypothetical protein [Terriglobales bacterium]